MDALEEPGQVASRSPAAEANRRPIILGQAISLFGDYIAYVTLPLLIVSLTGSSVDLGLTAAAETLPLALFGFAAGVLLDRVRILRVLILADLGRAAAFAALALSIRADVVTPGVVFAAAFIVGTMTVAFDSGLQAMLPGAVGQAALVDVNARLSLARTVAWSLGPAIGGLIVASRGGFTAAFLVNGLTFVASALFLVRVREAQIQLEPDRPRFGEALRRGLRFLMRDGHLRWATLGGTVANLVFAPLEALLVLFVATRLEGSVSVPGALAWLFADEAGVGLFIALQAAIGSVGVALAPRIARRMMLGRMYIVGMALLGAGFGVMAIMQTFWAVIPAGIAIAGVGWVNVALVTMRQRITPQRLLGRVTAASRTIAYILIPVGAALGGVLAETIGLVPLYLIAATVTMAVAAGLTLTPLGWRPISDSDTARWSDALGAMEAADRIAGSGQQE